MHQPDASFENQSLVIKNKSDDIDRFFVSVKPGALVLAKIFSRLDSENSLTTQCSALAVLTKGLWVISTLPLTIWVLVLGCVH